METPEATGIASNIGFDNKQESSIQLRPHLMMPPWFYHNFYNFRPQEVLACFKISEVKHFALRALLIDRSLTITFTSLVVIYCIRVALFSYVTRWGIHWVTHSMYSSLSFSSSDNNLEKKNIDSHSISLWASIQAPCLKARDMILLCCRWLFMERWKHFEFLSPSLNHWLLDF